MTAVVAVAAGILGLVVGVAVDSAAGRVSLAARRTGAGRPRTA